MKSRIICLSLILFMSIKLAAQGTGTPVAVTNAFNLMFPGAQNVKWGKENSKEWEAEFKVENIPISANFGLDGSWKETETTIKMEEVPAPVRNSLHNKYPAAKIKSSEKVEKPGKTYYEFSFMVGVKRKEVEISSEGKFM
jgi:hypothetical protein